MTNSPSIQDLLVQLEITEQPPTPEQWKVLWAALQGHVQPSIWTPLFSIDPHGTLLSWEASAQAELGYSEAMIGQNIKPFLSSLMEQTRLTVLLQEAGNSAKHADAEMVFKRQDGTLDILTCRLTPMRDAGGQVKQIDFAGNLTGDGENRQFLGRRRFYESIFDALPAAVALLDNEQRYIYCNPAAIRNPQIREWIIGKTDAEYVAYRGYDPQIAVQRDRFYQQAVLERRTVHFEESMPTPAGETVYQMRTYTPLYAPDGSLLLSIGHGIDITALKRSQEALTGLNNELEQRVKERTAALEAVSHQLQHEAFHDALTGLPNRSLFTERLEQLLRQPNTGAYAVLYLDTDRFKGVNDTLGHPAGDDMLCELALRLRRVLRGSDTVARLGGDEFGILLEPLLEPEQALRVARRIQEVLRTPIHLSGYDATVSVSIGIVLGEPGYDTAAALLRDADIAMYRAKAAGRDGYQVFTPEMRREVMAMNLLDNELRSGMKRSELRVLYQSIVNLQTMQVTGFEALVRWQHPERGLLPPGEFIHVAEDSGLLLDIDRWVLREACLQMKRWQQQHPHDQPLELSVNFSGRHFAVPGVADHVAEVLTQTGFDPNLLNLEITESALMATPQAIGESLDKLRALGLQLHLDDFGTGYSSLSYLQTYPLDTLKIDRSFVSGMLENPDSAELVRTIIAMAKNMKLCVVAEGIETPEQLRALTELGCEYGQGYLFARPLELAAAQAFATSFSARLEQ